MRRLPRSRNQIVSVDIVAGDRLVRSVRMFLYQYQAYQPDDVISVSVPAAQSGYDLAIEHYRVLSVGALTVFCARTRATRSRAVRF